MMSTPLWAGGTCLSEWKDYALPEFGTFETDDLKEGMVLWDWHLSNYSPDFWPRLFKDKGSGASSSGDGGQGAVVYTLAQHRALVRQGRVSEGQAADTPTSWIQLHGTGVRPALTSLGGNFLCKSERRRSKK